MREAGEGTLHLYMMHGCTLQIEWYSCGGGGKNSFEIAATALKHKQLWPAAVCCMEHWNHLHYYHVTFGLQPGVLTIAVPTNHRDSVMWAPVPDFRPNAIFSPSTNTIRLFIFIHLRDFQVPWCLRCLPRPWCNHRGRRRHLILIQISENQEKKQQRGNKTGCEPFVLLLFSSEARWAPPFSPQGVKGRPDRPRSRLHRPEMS